MDPTTITDTDITAWELAQDFYSAAALLARLTRGGVWKAGNLLWTAGWFARRWADRREQLHPLLRYQTPAEEGPAVPAAYPSPLSVDMQLCRAVQCSDDYLNELYRNV